MTNIRMEKMTKAQISNYILGSFLLLLAAGCAAPISDTFRREATPGVTFSMVNENPNTFRGNTVIWGGSIIKTVTTRKGSKIYVLQAPLDSNEEPQSTDTSKGRFIATTEHMLDPLVYAEGRMITVAGKVAGKKTVTRKKSSLSYTYPVVQSGQLYLWPRPSTNQAGYWRPYWGPYGGYDPDWDYPYFDEGFDGDDTDSN